MSVPRVTTNKSDGNTGVVRPSPDGICVVIAPCEKGTKNQPSSHTSDRRVLAEFGDGALLRWAALVMAIGGKPVVCIRADASTPAAYGDVALENEGTSVITADSTLPLDDYEVVIEFLTGGTVGTAGITYRVSLDGGFTWGGTMALGTANTLSIPNTGVGFDLAAGTVTTGQTLTCTTTGPRMTNADLLAALEALRTSALRWEAVLVHGEADATSTGSITTWITGQNAKGRFKTWLQNLRMMNAGETEAAYLAAMTTAMASMSSIDGVVGYDGTRVPCPVRGHVFKVPSAVVVAGRGMAIDIAEEPAYIARGPIPGATIIDDRGNPRDHNEEFFPGGDDLRATTLRSVEGENGVFITNTRLISPSGSDYVYWPHARVMNAGCETLHQILQKQLSKGIRKDEDAHILPEEADAIEGVAQDAVEQRLKNRASGVKVTLARDDDLSSNAGATLSAELAVSAIVYIKGFAVTAKFVRRITASAA